MGFFKKIREKSAAKRQAEIEEFAELFTDRSEYSIAKKEVKKLKRMIREGQFSFTDKYRAIDHVDKLEKAMALVDSIQYDAPVRREKIIKRKHSVDQTQLRELYDEIGDFLEFGDAVINIKYMNRKGDVTERDIVIKDIRESTYSDGFYINAHCMLRNEQRNFTIDNILSASVGGEKIDLIPYLCDLYQTNTYYKAIVVIKKNIDLVTILNYIALLDGRFMKKEKIIIAEFLKHFDPGIDTEMTTKKLSEIRPESGEFRKALKNIKNYDQEDLELLKATGIQLAGKDEIKKAAANTIPVTKKEDNRG